MVKALDSQRYFRWFDSGDVYSIDLAEKILAVMQATPWVKHWIPTRMAKFAKFKKVLSQMESLPNVKVRFSSDSVTGEHTSAHRLLKCLMKFYRECSSNITAVS
jgi:hypothetical protein